MPTASGRSCGRRSRAAPRRRFSGNIAWRFTIAEADGAGFPRPHERHGISRAVGPSRLLSAEGDRAASTSWPSPPATVAPRTGNAAARSSSGSSLLDALFRLAPADRHRCSSDGRADLLAALRSERRAAGTTASDTVLIGDAAHAMMPFAAQGAAMAIEDAFELAALRCRARPLAEALRSLRKTAGAAHCALRSAAPSIALPITPADRSGSAAISSCRCGRRKASRPISTGSTATSRAIELIRRRSPPQNRASISALISATSSSPICSRMTGPSVGALQILRSLRLTCTARLSKPPQE